MELVYDPEYLFKNFAADEGWFSETSLPASLEYLLWEFSNLNAPRDLLPRLTPAWEAYYRNLFREFPGQRVLMLGTGFGSLALLAAAAGKEVFACDRYPALAKVSQEIIQQQSASLPGTIRYFFKDFRELKAGSDIPHACDMFVFDDFDHTLLESGFLPLLAHCRRELLAPGARIVPGEVTIYARLLELSPDNHYFDMSPLEEHQWSVGAQPFNAAATHHRLLSETTTICHLDFSLVPESRRHKVTFRASDTGRWNAVCFWHEPCAGEPVYRLQYIDPLDVSAGREYEVTVYRLLTKMRFDPPGGVEKKRSRRVQTWHLDMLGDRVRNDAYARGIEGAVKNRGACHVLDIGSGSGLLSLMAASANPECRVSACEVLEGLCSTGAEVARRNGMEERVTCYNSDIRKLTLPEKADVIVHEVFASGMLGEGVLHFLDYALKNLAKPGATLVPRAARVRGMLIQHHLDTLFGFDVSAANAYRWYPDYSSLELNREKYTALSEAFEVFSFDFTSPAPAGEEKELSVPLVAGGIANAVVYWFELELDDTVRLSTGPFSPPTCWNQAIQYLRPLEVAEGEALALKIEHDGYRIHFGIDEEKLNPGRTFLAPSACDESWAARFTKLEKQYQELIFSAASLDETFAVLAGAALKIASDPGAFGVRGKYASRLVESLFIG